MPQHHSLTDPARKIATILGKAGYEVHPGIIIPTRRGGRINLTVVHERNRVRITIAAQGVQDLFLYGRVPENLVGLLREHLPTATIHERDHSKF